MSKFSVNIGFTVTKETSPGIWEEQIVERRYFGEVTKNYRKWQNNQQVNKDLNISNIISILADPYAYNNIGHVKFVEWMNSKWEVTDIEVAYPRMNLTVGGLYNG